MSDFIQADTPAADAGSHEEARAYCRDWWALASALMLVVAWDVAGRLDERVFVKNGLPQAASPERSTIVLASEAAPGAIPGARDGQNALMPVSARPTVN